MKRIILCATLLFLVFACRNELKISNEALYADKELIKVLSYTFTNNDRVDIALSETAMLTEYEFRNTIYPDGRIARNFSILLDPALSMGEVQNLSFTIRKDSGLITRASLRLIGKNPNIPKCIINELSIKGTSTAPDRIEILILEDGNMNGIAISDDLYLNGYAFAFPDLVVQEGDILVVYWNIETEERIVKKKDGLRTIYINASAPSTLISTDGMVLLFKDLDGEVIDAIIYSDDIENEDNAFGTEKLRRDAQTLIEKGLWHGDPVDSSLVTSSRVLARFPDSEDSNSAEDWFTTSTRKSTFGELNTSDVYTP